MSVPLRIHPEAESEFADAIRTYGKHADELALDFEKAVEEGRRRCDTLSSAAKPPVS